MRHMFKKTTVGFLGLVALVLSDSHSFFETPMATIANLYKENRELISAPSAEDVFASTELKLDENISRSEAKPSKKKIAQKLKLKPKKTIKIVGSDKKLDKALAHIGELTLQKADDAKPFAEACSGFIQRDGHYGKIGQELVRNMKKTPYKDQYLRSKSLSQVCPNYKNLKAQQKLQAWVWFWMVLSNEESSCQVETPHGTHAKVAGRWIRINPKEGYGLFAAELYGGDRQWRGDMCRGNMKTMKVQVSCAIHTMYDRHLAEGEGAYTKSSYWGPVRRLDKQIVPNMGLYKPCFDGGRYAAQ
jgi:hypothetical protein